MNLKIRLKKIICELVQDSTVYGLPKILRSKRTYSRVFWVFFFFASLTAASYYIVTDLVDYFSYDVVTVVKTVYDQHPEFPTISFCSRKQNIPFKNGLQNEYWFNSKKLDSENDFESFISINYDNCLRFNSGKNMTNHSIPIRKSNYGGTNFAFEIQFKTPKGLVLMIHNKSSSPNFEIYYRSDYIYAYPGFQTNIAVERTFESKLEEPHNECLKDVSTFKRNKTVIDYFHKKNQSYSQEKCLELCFDIFYINDRACQCDKAQLGNVPENCYETDYNSCTWKYQIDFVGNNNLIEKCSDYCPLECDTISYSFTIDRFPNEPNAAYLTVVNIFYQTLKYTSINQLAKTKPKQLISNLGGYLGLFVGLSFVSLFEIIEIIIEIIFILLDKPIVIKEHKTQQHSETVTRTEIELLKKENDEKLRSLQMENEAKIKQVKKLINKIRVKYLINIFIFYFILDHFKHTIKTRNGIS